MDSGIDNNGLPEGYTLDENDNHGLPPGYQLEGVAPIEPHENFLQRAISQNRGMNQLPLTGIGMLPMNQQEMGDLPKIAMNQVPQHGIAGLVGAFGGQTSEFPHQQPETQYGKNVSTAANIAPWAILGLEGATAGARGIQNFFSTGDLPQQIESTKGNIQDLIHTGPQKVKERIGNIFNEAQQNFGERMGAMPGGFDSQMTSQHFADALNRTADELGGKHIAGSQGNQAFMMAQDMMKNPRTFYPQDIQAQSKSILDSFGNDMLSKTKFYKHFTDILSEQAPELADIKSEYAPVFDIANQSKVINKGNLGRVASGKIGPEQLGEMTQAQQMMGDNPNIVEQADAAGRKLSSQQEDLKSIISRQKTAKNVGKWGARAVGLTGIEELLRHLWRRE